MSSPMFTTMSSGVILIFRESLSTVLSLALVRNVAIGSSLLILAKYCDARLNV